MFLGLLVPGAHDPDLILIDATFASWVPFFL